MRGESREIFAADSGGGMNSLPSLTGIERARLEDWNWACATFSWAVLELRITEAAVAAHPQNERLWKAGANTLDAIKEKLEEWEPPHRAN